MLGGARASEVTTEVTAMVDGLLEAFKEQATRAGHNGIVTKLSATEAQSQVVAGTNYFVKVQINDSEHYAFLRIFKPLPHTNAPPELVAIQLGKTSSDAVCYFEADA